MSDVISQFIAEHTQLSNIILALIVACVIIALLMYGGIKRIEIVVLCIALVFIYLYYNELVGIQIFAFILLICSILITFMFVKSNRSE